METDVGWSGGEEMGLNRAPVITSQPLVRSRFRKESHPPSLALEETSGYSSQVLSAEKGALRTWAAAGLHGHKSYKRSHVLCSLQVELCCGFICSSQQPLNSALSVPIFTGTERSTGQDHTERNWQSWDLNLDTWFKILNSPLFWHCTLDPRGME